MLRPALRLILDSDSGTVAAYDNQFSLERSLKKTKKKPAKAVYRLSRIVLGFRDSKAWGVKRSFPNGPGPASRRGPKLGE